MYKLNAFCVMYLLSALVDSQLKLFSEIKYKIRNLLIMLPKYIIGLTESSATH